jgi:hypothetical protein
MKNLPELLAQMILTCENCSPDFDAVSVDDFFDAAEIDQKYRSDFGFNATLEQALEIIDQLGS